MNILITCNTLTYLSGSCLYNYTLAMEFAKQGHEVTVYSNFFNWPTKDKYGKKMFEDLTGAGIRCIDATHESCNLENKYDYVFCSQRTGEYLFGEMNVGIIANIIHSEYDCEMPINEADYWVAIRPSIKQRLMNEFKIDEDCIKVIYNGVDRERFNPEKRIKPSRNYTKIVIPCTIDLLREKFLNWYSDHASDKFRVEVYGLQCGANVKRTEFMTFHDPVFDIDEVIADTDYVAGILLGRVNIESASMHIPSLIHDPEHPELFETFLPSEELFDKRHNIVNVAKELLSL